MNSVEEIAGVLKRLKSAAIFTHTRPDGDAVGSAMALGRALSCLKIRNQVVVDGPIPAKFAFLGGTEEIGRVPTIDAEGYVCVDASDENRLGDLSDVFLRGAKRGKTTINIDHHVSNARFCKYNFVSERASNCENVYLVVRALGVPIDERIATYLMAGIVTDSGGFSHGNVTGETFRTAAVAADCGADASKITYELFRKQSKARAQLYLSALSGMRYLLNDELAAVVIPAGTLEAYGLGQDATEGIVDFGLTVDVVEVSACLLEVRKGQYKVSFRSKGKVNVNEVAGRFGGGGHAFASGCMLFGSLEEVLDKLSYAVYQHLGDA